MQQTSLGQRLPCTRQGQGTRACRSNRAQRKTRRPLPGETRVTWRTLAGLQSQAMRSMAGLWLPRLPARGPLRQDTRRDGATAERPAPRHAGGPGRRGPPLSR
jgi:hypothetical protein